MTTLTAPSDYIGLASSIGAQEPTPTSRGWHNKWAALKRVLYPLATINVPGSLDAVIPPQPPLRSGGDGEEPVREYPSWTYFIENRASR